MRLHFGLRIPAFSLLYLCLLSSTLPIHLLCQHPAPIRRRSHEHEHSDYNRRMGFDRMHSEGLESEASMSGSECGSPERNQAGPSKRKSTSKSSVRDGKTDQVGPRQPRQPLRRGDACLMCRAKKLVSTLIRLCGK
jgi:hypothetical protein